MDELISRQAAIDALDVLCQEHRYKIPGKRETYSQYNEAWQDALDRAEGAIENLPSAQPEPCEDAVSRKDVVKFLDDWMSALDANCHHQSMADLKIIKNDLENLPSAQPEHNPDDERKIADLHKMVNYLLSRLEQRWIPVRERLPEKPNMYTVTDSNGNVVRFVFYDTESSREYWLRCAKAWMPLPEPYREEGGE